MSTNDQTTTEATEQTEQDGPSGLIGWTALLFRFLYTNRYTGFVIDTVAIGSALFLGIIVVMMGLVSISNFFGGWHVLYIGCVLTFGVYGASKVRDRRTSEDDPDEDLDTID